MPRLPAPLADQANEAQSDSRDFKPLDAGVYTGRLSKVEAANSRDGKAMWKIEFDQIFDLDNEKQPGRQWSNMTLEESTAWKVAQFFAAFGVGTTTDTDELLNHRIRLEITQRVIPTGARAGALGNNVDRFSPLIEGDAGFDKNQQLASKLARETAKPVKAAPRKAAPAAAKVPADAAAVDDSGVEPDDLDDTTPGIEDDPDAVDF